MKKPMPAMNSPKNIKEELEDSKNSFCGIHDTENVKLKLRQFKDLECIENKKAPVPPQIKPTVFVWFMFFVML